MERSLELCMTLDLGQLLLISIFVLIPCFLVGYYLGKKKAERDRDRIKM